MVNLEKIIFLLSIASKFYIFIVWFFRKAQIKNFLLEEKINETQTIGRPSSS